MLFKCSNNNSNNFLLFVVRFCTDLAFANLFPKELGGLRWTMKSWIWSRYQLDFLDSFGQFSGTESPLFELEYHINILWVWCNVYLYCMVLRNGKAPIIQGIINNCLFYLQEILGKVLIHQVEILFLLGFLLFLLVLTPFGHLVKTSR